MHLDTWQTCYSDFDRSDMVVPWKKLANLHMKLEKTMPVNNEDAHVTLSILFSFFRAKIQMKSKHYEMRLHFQTSPLSLDVS